MANAVIEFSTSIRLTEVQGTSVVQYQREVSQETQTTKIIFFLNLLPFPFLCRLLWDTRLMYFVFCLLMALTISRASACPAGHFASSNATEMKASWLFTCPEEAKEVRRL